MSQSERELMQTFFLIDPISFEKNNHEDHIELTFGSRYGAKRDRQVHGRHSENCKKAPRGWESVEA